MVNVKKAIAATKKEPLYVDKNRHHILEYASCISTDYVIKYKVDTNFDKVDKVVDGKIKKFCRQGLISLVENLRRHLRIYNGMIKLLSGTKTRVCQVQ